MKRLETIYPLAIRRMVWVVLAILFTLAIVAQSRVFALGAAETASAEATRLLVTLLRSPGVQTELKLDARQAAAVDAAVAEIDEPLWRLRDAPARQSAADVRTLRSKFDAELHATLQPKQQRRLEQLLWRAQGVWALQDARLADRLALTAAQKELIAGSLGSLDRSSPAAKVAELEKQVMAGLTDKQRLLLPEALGQTFDLSQVRQIGVKAPEIRGIEGWVNSRPIKLADLRGKVVVLHFWTFGCINCIHNLPVYKTWYDELPRDKVEIVGVHTPETAAEHEFDGLQRAAKQRDLKFPIAMDLHAETWKAWGNSVWPAVYLIDRHGDVRYWWTGELKWKGADGDKLMLARIKQLIAEKD
jgi:peroxiredoxin